MTWPTRIVMIVALIVQPSLLSAGEQGDPSSFDVDVRWIVICMHWMSREYINFV
jgi:hypothetical protein